ncbi:MAG: hypothetical protein ACOCYW_05440 [Roseicyclus sp.]
MITEADLQGHWRRDWIRIPGHEDRTTRVHWLQAGALYADIRVPHDRPRLPGSCLAEATAPDIAALMRAEAFAGTISVEGGVCTWAREVNWHGTPEGVDAGAMAFEDGALIETGVHADYAERWVREGTGLRTSRVTSGTHAGVLVEDAGRFLLVMGVRGAPSSAPLVVALERGTIPPGVAAHFAQPCAMGRWEGSAGIAELALDPFAEGRVVLERSGPGLTLRWPGFDGRQTAEALSQSDR